MSAPPADGAPRRFAEVAHGFQQRGDSYRAADCLERALAIAPADNAAHEALELFYRSTREWPVLIDLLHRRALHADDKERAAMPPEIAPTPDPGLADHAAAFQAT